MPLVDKPKLLAALDRLIEAKVQEFRRRKKDKVRIVSTWAESIRGKNGSLIQILHFRRLSESIQGRLRPWDGVVLTTGLDSANIVLKGLFLEELSSSEGHIAVESPKIRIMAGDSYYLAKDDTIPLLESQRKNLTTFSETSWTGRILLNDQTPSSKGSEPQSKLDLNLNESQLSAYSSCISMPKEDFFLVHGPPGTGKTEIITHILIDCLRKGRKVLLTSHTNVAVDNALERLIEHSEQGEKQRISRIGSLLKTSSKVAEILPQIRLGRTLTSSEIIGEISKRNVVGMTLSKLGLVRGLFPSQLHFDITIVDEASMASIPLSLLGAADITDRLILVGDHRQLAPIVEVGDEFVEQQLSISLFEKLIDRYPDKSQLLDTQYRCSRDIMEYCSQEFYGGKVRTDGSVDERTKKSFSTGSADSTWLGSTLGNSRGLVWVDTEELSNSEWVQYGSSWSAFNKAEAIVVLNLWLQLLKAGIQQNSISVMSPFRLQTDIMRETAKRILPDEKDSSVDSVFLDLDRRHQTFATIDANQGKEFDIVIFNVTKSSIGRDSDEAGRSLGDERRLNVALTRAKMKAIIVGSNNVADVSRLFHYFRLFMYAKQIGSLVRIRNKDFLDASNRDIEKEIEKVLENKIRVEGTKKVASFFPEPSELFCPHCGNRVHESWDVCFKCHKRLQSLEKQPEPKPRLRTSLTVIPSRENIPRSTVPNLAGLSKIGAVNKFLRDNPNAKIRHIVLGTGLSVKEVEMICDSIGYHVESGEESTDSDKVENKHASA